LRKTQPRLGRLALPLKTASEALAPVNSCFRQRAWRMLAGNITYIRRLGTGCSSRVGQAVLLASRLSSGLMPLQGGKKAGTSAGLQAESPPHVRSTGACPVRAPRRFWRPIAGALLFAVAGWAQAPGETRELSVLVGKSVMIDSTPVIQRVSVASPEVADAIVVNPHEVLINGRAPGSTSLIIWQEGGGRIFFNLVVRPDVQPTLDQLRETFPEGNVELSFENRTWFLRGTVRDATEAERAQAIAATAGPVVNLLRVEAPPAEPQIMLKVRFADVDRAAIQELGANIISSGALNTIGVSQTGQFGAIAQPNIGGPQGAQQPFLVQDLLNIFAFRPDLNIGVTIRALQQRRLLQLLAEPNLVTLNNREANFLAGGEFPFPVVQGGAAAGAVTIQFREFGVRINFLPVLTHRNTIRLRVRPEVSSLDFANALSISGFTVPAISTRRIDSEVELADGQSFVIGGLLDNRTIETFSKIPGLGDIPIIKNLFRSRATNRSNTELIVLVTPELVQPYEAGQPLPSTKFDVPFLEVPGQQAPTNPKAPAPSPPGGSR
jgi:pilus assembly protein CpaC